MVRELSTGTPPPHAGRMKEKPLLARCREDIDRKVLKRTRAHSKYWCILCPPHLFPSFAFAKHPNPVICTKGCLLRVSRSV